MAIKETLDELVAPLVADLGYEFVGLEYQSNPKHRLLRVYIDKEDGVNLDDCEQVSREVSALLDVEDPINGQYSLEVSSPGVERPLFTSEQFDHYRGEQARVWLHAPEQGRRKLHGVIVRVEDGLLTIAENGLEIEVTIDNIQKAHLAPDLDALMKH